MKKWFNFKTFYRFGIVGYVALVMFISYSFLLLLIPYIAARLTGFIVEFRGYDEWKYVRYGKYDRRFAIRRLYYIMNACKKNYFKKAVIDTDYNGNFAFGKVSIDEFLKIHMRTRGLRYETNLYFKDNLVASCTGYSFQTVKWKLEDLPEVKRAVEKFQFTIEQDFEQLKKEKNKSESKDRKALAKEIRQAYKKESSL